MPELKLFKSINFTPTNIDVSAIRFKDKTREKQRQTAIAKRAQAEPKKPLLLKKRQTNEAWSAKAVTKEKRMERRDKKERKKAAIVKAKQATGEDDNDEDYDLDVDYRALKKEKKLAKLGIAIDASEADEDD